MARLVDGLQRGSDTGVLTGIGDDCAVLQYCDDQLLLVTTDMLVEEQHFSLQWFSPQQIGHKAAEASLSDIAAMGR